MVDLLSILYVPFILYLNFIYKMSNHSGCGDSICIDKPMVVEKQLNIGSLSRKTLVEEIFPERPMYRTEFGRVTWRLLHRITTLFPTVPTEEDRLKMDRMFKGLSTHFPCKECADHFKNEIEIYPPKVNSNKDIITWLCYQHNQVNKRLNKNTFDCGNLNKLLDDYRL